MGIGEKGTCFRIGLWPLDIFGVVFGLVGSTVVFQVYVDLIVTKYKRTRRMEDSKIRKGWGEGYYTYSLSLARPWKTCLCDLMSA
jgi:hypothetical protein